MQGQPPRCAATVLAVVLALCLCGPPGTAGRLQLPRVVTSSMVLQAETPAVHGFGDAGATVAVSVSDGLYPPVSVVVQPSGSWRAELGRRNASFAPVEVHISSGSDTVVLKDVLFGDVWVCSGQSNMEFSVAEIFRAQEVIANSNVAGLRLFAVQKNASTVPLNDTIATQEGWVRSSPATVCGAEYGNQSFYCEPHCGPSCVVKSFKRPTWGYFSAVCYLHGLNLVEATKRPQGMLESCWGGTPIRAWSGPDALAMCSNGSRAVHGPAARPVPDGDDQVMAASSLWNSMVVPLLPVSIRGALWYQGEADARSIASGNQYLCEMKAMIQDWRAKWVGSDSEFTFILAQLAAYQGAPGVMATRWSQLGAASELNKVGTTIGIDLADPGSPCGNVHIRNKTAVGARMARVARALSYGESIAYRGPIVDSLSVQDGSIGVTFIVSSQLEFRSVGNQTTTQDYCIETTTDNKTWQAAASVSVQGTDLVLVKAGAGVVGIRYAWAEVPAGLQLYDGELPASPFLAACTPAACQLVAPGMVPE